MLVLDIELAFDDILLPIRPITKFSMHGNTPAYARIVCTNKVVHVTRSHAANVPAAEASKSSVKLITQGIPVSSSR
jgi:hypothetical protein